MRCGVAFAILIACGDNYIRPVDAPPPADAARMQDAPAVGQVTISVGRPDVLVVMQAHDSSQLGRFRTGIDGNASGTMEAGGYVTVIDPYGPVFGLSQVRTFADVQPGDQLEMHDSDNATFTGPLNMTVTAPAASDPAIVRYLLVTQPVMHVANIGPGATLQASVERPQGVSTADFLFLGYDSSNVVRSSLFAGNVTLGDSVDLGAYSQSSLASHSTVYFGVPQTKGAQITEALATVRGTLYSTTKGVEVDQQSASTQMLQPVAVGGFDDLSYEATTPTQTIRLIERRPYGEGFVIKVKGRLMSEVTTCPTYDAISRRLSWTEPPEGVAPNFVLASIKNFDVEWTMIAPANGVSVTFPVPMGFSTRFPYVFKKLERAFTPGGYRAVRSTSFWPYASIVDGGGALGHVTTSEIRVERCPNL